MLLKVRAGALNSPGNEVRVLRKALRDAGRPRAACCHGVTHEFPRQTHALPDELFELDVMDAAEVRGPTDVIRCLGEPVQDIAVGLRTREYKRINVSRSDQVIALALTAGVIYE